MASRDFVTIFELGGGEAERWYDARSRGAGAVNRGTSPGSVRLVSTHRSHENIS
jgi:hypothetical protein